MTWVDMVSSPRTFLLSLLSWPTEKMDNRRLQDYHVAQRLVIIRLLFQTMWSIYQYIDTISTVHYTTRKYLRAAHMNRWPETVPFLAIQDLNRVHASMWNLNWEIENWNLNWLVHKGGVKFCDILDSLASISSFDRASYGRKSLDRYLHVQLHVLRYWIDITSVIIVKVPSDAINRTWLCCTGV